MKKSKLLTENLKWFWCILTLVFSASIVSAQSTRVESPTPITSTEINGKIAARDIGDSRLTTYYYAFSGTQGDIFLKIQATNLNGDIDIFYAENMRPLTKISLFADSSTTQTGREIYLRKPEKLILRVEGRTLNDDPATFSIKFDGSFQALTTDGTANDLEAPKVKNEVEGSVRVNSVGTIIETEPKSAPEKTEASNTKKRITTPKSISTADENTETPAAETENLNRKRVISDSPPEKIPAKRTTRKSATTARNPVRRTARPPTRRTTPPAKTAADTGAEELATVLENVRLVVLLKDGGKIDRPMSEILRFSVDKGTLTIISKNGSISRYSILDVTKVSIE